jgi:lysozyme family protein
MFEKAVTLILKHEGGYVNDPRDPGGETNFGISKRAYPSLDIKKLSITEAKLIYKRDYWTPCRCDELPYPIALLLFDAAVNMGVMAAIKLLQAACLVTSDGVFGSQTMTKVHAMDTFALASTYCTLRMEKYISLPTFQRFGHGWTKRTFETAITAFR